ncbi:histone [Candidatus Neptunichlamydia sp. REUL1]|uniref:histone n=1 Tax=Candidatus Neptunichlamydia sp. REUL1 TaxID=3064277 RepID=UPI00292F8A08|nr:histone [Candidatus Neptunochlamydia sp. REUL1]
MALKDTVKKMERMLMDLAVDLRKASEKGNRAASQRVRTGTITFAKVAKQYRKESVSAEKKGSGKKRKKAKKTTRKKVAKKKTTKKKAVHKKAPVRKKKVARKKRR